MRKTNPLNILISGANEGIGYHMVESLLKQNHNVFVLDIKTDGLEKLSDLYPKDRLFFDLCDISDEQQVISSMKKVASELDHIDYVIHNACKCTFESFENATINSFKQVYDVNFFGALHLIKHTLPILEKQRKGNIFITSSGVGIMGFREISPYASSKAALESLVKCLNIEYKSKNIHFHIIHPPLTLTNSSKGLNIPVEFMANPKKVGQGLAKRIHKKRRVIAYSKTNQLTVGLMYLFPVSMGKLLSKMTEKATSQKGETT